MKTALSLLIAVCCLVAFGETASCGKTYFTSDSGTISSRSPYARGQSCVYQITLTYFISWIHLKFTSFDVDGEMPSCSKDRLEVWSGCTIKRKLVTFCKNNMIASVPHDVYAKGNCAEVRLYASSQESSKSNRNFALTYTSSGGGSAGVSYSCINDRNLYSSSGVISSPRWPESFKRDDFPYYGRYCEWDIETDQQNLVQVNVMDTDMCAKCSGTYSYCSSQNYLQVKGEKSVIDNPSLSGQCSSSYPYTLNTKYYKVEVKLRGSYRSYKRGFVLGYVTYRDDEAAEKAKWGLIIGVIVLVLFVFLAFFFIYRRCRARSRASTQQSTALYGSSNTTTTTTTHQAAPVQPPVSMPLVDNSYPKDPYQAQPGYPTQPGYPMQPTYPAQPGYPMQPTYPAQPGYSDAPPPYPGPPMDQNSQYPPPATGQPYPPPINAPGPYTPAPYPPLGGSSYPPPVN